jgi:hypothetical protein
MEIIITSILNNLPFIIISVLGFYFYTKYELTSLHKEIKQIKEDVDKVRDNINIIKTLEANILVQQERLINLNDVIKELKTDIRDIKKLLEK